MERAGAIVLLAVNRLLRGERWARTMLQAHAGQTAAIDLAGMAMRFTVSGEGLIEPSGASQEPADVHIVLPASALAFLPEGMSKVGRHARVVGNAHFAETLQTLAQYLRPDLGAALSPVIGDALAHRVAAGCESLAGSAERSLRGLGENLLEYLRDETGVLLREEEYARFAREIAALRDDLARCEKRVQRIADAT